jgi:hypothetical protein
VFFSLTLSNDYSNTAPVIKDVFLPRHVAGVQVEKMRRCGDSGKKGGFERGHRGDESKMRGQQRKRKRRVLRGFGCGHGYGLIQFGELDLR